VSPAERMWAAVRGEPADRLPFATYNCHGFSWGGHAACPEYAPILEAIRRTGAGMLCKLRARRAGGMPAPQVARAVEGDQELTTETLATPGGTLRRVFRNRRGQPARCVEHYLKTDADVESFLSLRPEPVRWEIDELLAMVGEIGRAGVAYLDYRDPFGSVAGLFDQEDFLIRIHTDPAPVMALIERAFRTTRDELHALLEVLSGPRPNVLFYTCGPEWATPPLMRPELFARVVTPYQSPLVAMIHEHGFPVSLHCHGRVRLALPEILKCRFDVLEPIEPPSQGDIDLGELRAAVGDQMALMGYVQDQDFFTATPQRMRDHVARIVAAIGRGAAARRYIATPTCTPFAFPPPPQYVANYVAFLEAAAELGA